jgi:hypothetical protein
MNMVRESTMSEITKRNHDEACKNSSEKKRGILGKASEEDQRLYRNGLATVCYRTGRIVRI